MNNSGPKASIGGARHRQLAGLKNRGETTVVCADCGRALMRFLITRNNADLAELGAAPITTKVQCLCRPCGGKSYVRDIEGSFFPGTYSDTLAFDVVDSDGGLTVFEVWDVTEVKS